jgi:uncharacterized membrane protein (DUF485 family)
MTVVKMPIALISTFVWIGFICAISFMEAWLKFRAPGITVPLGLGIGRLVFNALNKVELLFAVVILVNIFWNISDILKWKNIAFAIPLTLLFIQTFWLLPALDARAELHIQGQIVPSSNLHFYYVVIELVKVASLILFGIKLFKSTTI